MAKIPYRRRLLLLALLSLADLCLTWWLLGLPGGGVYESNPLAAWCLDCQGWVGLTLYKVATVLVGSTLLVVYCRHRPRAGRHALTLACSLVAAIVVYSGCLAATLDWSAIRAAAPDPEDRHQGPLAGIPARSRPSGQPGRTFLVAPAPASSDSSSKAPRSPVGPWAATVLPSDHPKPSTTPTGETIPVPSLSSPF